MATLDRIKLNIELHFLKNMSRKKGGLIADVLPLKLYKQN